MNDLLKKELLLGTQKVVVGSKHNDLILRTLGRVYVLTGSKFTLLTDYLQNNVTASEDKTIVLTTEDEIVNIEYPGDGYFIFITLTKDLYISYGGEYIPLLQTQTADIDISKLNKLFLSVNGGTVNNYLNVDGNLSANKIKSSGQIESTYEGAPLKVVSRQLVKNLNAEYLNGTKGDLFTKRNENETISGSWKFLNENTFKDNVRFNKSLYSDSGFAPGFSGYGWMLDHETNTLTIDNLVVRKVMHVYELVVNKISATNGALWVTDSAKIQELHMVDEDSIYFVERESEEFDKLSAYMQYDELTDLNIFINVYEAYYTGDFYYVQLDTDYNPFRLNDLLRCQRFDGSNIKYYDAIVTGLPEANSIIIRISSQTNDIYNQVTKVTDSLGEVISVSVEDKPQAGYTYDQEGNIVEISSIALNRIVSGPEINDGLVRIGNTVNKDRLGAIYLTSNDVNGPYIDINADMVRPDFNASKPIKLANGRIVYQKPLKVRLGNLNGIYDPAFGIDQPEGYGLYGENVFIKGRLVQVSPDGSESPVIIYRGEWNENSKYYLNNLVTFEKLLYICLRDGVLGLEQSPNNPTYWKLISESGEGSVGPQGPSINIVSEKLFMYKDNYETFVGPEAITATYEINNTEYTQAEWLITLDDGTERVIDRNRPLLIFPTDALMQLRYGNGQYWEGEVLTIKLKVYANSVIYTDIESIFKQSSGASTYKVEIISSRGTVFKEGWRTTTLKALLYYDNTRITDFTNYLFVWERYDREGIKDEAWTGYLTDSPDIINISDKDVFLRATFNCTIYKNGLKLKL